MVPHPTLLLTGLALGAAAAVAGVAGPPRRRAWVVPVAALLLVAVAPGPDLADAVTSWELNGAVAALAVLGAAVTAAAAGSMAARLGPAGAMASVGATAVAVGLAVPDTEGPVLAVGLLAALGLVVLLVARRGADGWPVPAAATAVASAAVVLVGLTGATDGGTHAVAAWGAVVVVAGAAATGNRFLPLSDPGDEREAGRGDDRDGEPEDTRWPPFGVATTVAVPLVVAAASVAVARAGVAGASWSVVLVVTAGGTTVVAAAARLTSARGRLGR